MLLGIDLGTGSAKAAVLTPDGGTAGVGTAPYEVRAPRDGWAETEPRDWWGAVVRAVREATGGRGHEIGVVGLSGQMHGVVLADAAGEALRPAILWADNRSSGSLRAYERLGSEARRRLANPPAAGMAGPSLVWLRNNEPGGYAAARWALQPKDWLRARLTGEFGAEPSDASATLLYDVEGDRWDGEVVGGLGLEPALLPAVLPSASVAGELGRGAADALGLRAGIPVSAGAADTAAAMLGTGLVDAGEAQLTVGTGAQVVVPRAGFEPDSAGRTHLFRTVWGDGPAGTPYYAMAAIQNAGLALEWVLKALGATWGDVGREAFGVAPGAGGVTFVPYLSGERTPVFDAAARASWSGLGLGHGRAHLLRAALEGVAFAVRDGVDALQRTGVRVGEVRLAGGGAVGEPWCGMLSDVLGRPLLPLPGDVARVASARGAALLGGLAAGDLVPADLPRPPTGEPFLPSDHEAYAEARERYLKARADAAGW